MRVYLDYNASCPMLDCALEAYVQTAKQAVGNASSLHWAGRSARRMLDDARDCLAQYLEVESGTVVFTSGGTESNNMAIHGFLATQEPGHVLTTAIEHASVLEPLKQWSQADGWTVSHVKPNREGCFSIADIEAALRPDTRLLSVMLANNETGIVSPIDDIAALCLQRGVPLMIDAVQGLGKLALKLPQWQPHFVSLSAHKIGGPKGVGALIVKRGVRLQAWQQGGGQERKRRSGTENLPAIAGFVAALGVLDFAPLARLRDAFEQQLLAALPRVRLYGQQAERVGNTSMFSLSGVDSETMLMQLDLKGFAVSSGSACSSGKRQASYVLQAMGIANDLARASLRISLGPDSNKEQLDALIVALCEQDARLAAMRGRRYG